MLSSQQSKQKGCTTGEALEAYIKLKSILCSEPVMAYTRSDRIYALIFDASTGTEDIECGMGAILTQIDKTLCSMHCHMHLSSLPSIKRNTHHTCWI